MKEVLSEFFTSKLFIIFSLFLLFGSISLFAGNVIVNEYGIQSDNYYSSSGEAGLTQNISYIGWDGQNYTLVIKNGLIINTTQVIDEAEELPLNSSFPAEGLIAYYKFDESSGSTADDSYSMNDGVYYGNLPTQVSGKVGYGQDFEGTNDYVSMGDIMDTEVYTINLWIYPDFWANNYVIVRKNVAGSTGFRVFEKSGGVIRYEIQDGGNEYTIDTSDIISTGRWYMMTFLRHSNGTAEVYVNGTQVAYSDSTTYTLNNEGLEFGDGRGLGLNIDATYDEIGIWNRALSPSEISRLYNNGEGLTYS